MSPEQVEANELDGQSNVFSLGAVLLTGQRAFEDESQLSVASAILERSRRRSAASNRILHADSITRFAAAWQRILAVDGKGASFNVGRSQRLFVAPANPFASTYDVARDGQRFVMSASPGRRASAGPHARLDGEVGEEMSLTAGAA